MWAVWAGPTRSGLGPPVDLCLRSHPCVCAQGGLAIGWVVGGAPSHSSEEADQKGTHASPHPGRMEVATGFPRTRQKAQEAGAFRSLQGSHCPGVSPGEARVCRQTSEDTQKRGMETGREDPEAVCDPPAGPQSLLPWHVQIMLGPSWDPGLIQLWPLSPNGLHSKTKGLQSP